MRHEELNARVPPQLAHCDTAMLAHFSASTALSQIQEVMDIPLLRAPEAATLNLKPRPVGLASQIA